MQMLTKPLEKRLVIYERAKPVRAIVLTAAMFASASVVLSGVHIPAALLNNGVTLPITLTTRRMLWQRYRTWIIIASFFLSAMLAGPLAVAVWSAFLCWHGGQEYGSLMRLPARRRWLVSGSGWITLTTVLLGGPMIVALAGSSLLYCFILSAIIHHKRSTMMAQLENATTLLTQSTDVKLDHDVQVKKSGPIASVKWALMRSVLSTVGRTSKGVQIGYTHGFDSGSMLDYVYINRASGRLGIGKLIDRAYLDSVSWRAIRARRDLLKKLLRKEVERNRAVGMMTRLLDVAAGPGHYLQELLRECDPEQGDLRVLCRDLSSDGVRQGRVLASEQGLLHIHYEEGDAFDSAPTDAQLGEAPNVIVVSGLYELILDDATIQTSLQQLYQLLAPGGVLLFTTQIHHPQLEFIVNVLPNREGVLWVTKCRAASQLEGWAREAGFQRVWSQLEDVGLFTVTIARKERE